MSSATGASLNTDMPRKSKLPTGYIPSSSIRESMPETFTNSKVKEHRHITVGDVLDGPDPF